MPSCTLFRPSGPQSRKSEKRDKYFDFVRELRKLWNMKVTVILTVFGALGTVLKGWEKGAEELEVGGRAETIQTAESLRSARILRGILET